MTARVLVLEDDDSLRLVVSRALSRDGHEVRATASIDTAIEKMIRRDADVLVADVVLGQQSFLERFAELRRARPDAPVIVMSAQTTAATAIEAAQGGAFEYLPKPFDLKDLSDCVTRALSGGRRTGAQPPPDRRFAGLVGRSPAMQGAFQALGRLAGTRDPVVLFGAEGSGRASAARTLHRARHGGAVGLIEAGPARLEREGLAVFDAASGAGLLLRRAEQWSQATQDCVLEALETTGDQLADRLYVTVRPDGLARLSPALANRLAIGQVILPRLRDRAGDVRLLFEQVLQQRGAVSLELTARAWIILERHGWPGEVLELERVAARLANLGPGRTVGEAEVRAAIAPVASDHDRDGEGASARLDEAASDFAAEALAAGREDFARTAQDAVEAALIRATLRATGGVRLEAARRLGLNRNTLARRITALGLDRED